MSAIVWFWDHGCLRPARRHVDRAAKEFEEGGRYVLEAVEEAQAARDMAYHATIREYWLNLPEGMSERFSNPTDFRRWLLVECGFCDVAKLAFASSKAAMAALPFLQSEGAQISVVGSAAVVKKPWSQRLRGGMKREVRMQSYQDTQDLAASLIGVSPDDARHGEAA